MRRSLARLFAPLAKWWPLLVAATLVAALSGVVGAWREPSTYMARSMLVVGSELYRTNPSVMETQVSIDLAWSYSQLALSAPVAEAVMKKLNLPALPRYSAYTHYNSPLIYIEVVHEDPRLAQALVNALANELVQRSPGHTNADEIARLNFLRAQMVATQERIIQTNLELGRARQSLKGLTSASEILAIKIQVAGLESKLTSLQYIYTDMLDNVSRGTANSVEMFTEAELPVEPYGPNRPVLVLFAALSGLLFSIGAAYVIETYDSTVKHSDEVLEMTGVPVIGAIGVLRGPARRGLVASRAPLSAAADSFRSLRANLDFLIHENHIRTLLVTSSGPQEGKSTLSANLAAFLALADRKVVVVDTDLRRPALHQALDMDNRSGVSELCLGAIKLDDALQVGEIRNLQVLTSGAQPPNPAELLRSRSFAGILAELSERFDLVVLDGPPALIADSLALAASVDAVVFVARAGYTTRDGLLECIRQIQQVGGSLAGVVLNRAPEARNEPVALPLALPVRLARLVNRVLGREVLMRPKPGKYPLPRRNV